MYNTINHCTSLTDIFAIFCTCTYTYTYVGHSPLARCLLAGFTDGVLLLLTHKADTTAVNIHGQTLLMTAINTRTPTSYIKQLLEQYKASGGLIDAVDNRGQTALMKALQQNCIDTIDLLLSYDAKFYVADCNGDTSLAFVQSDTCLTLLQQRWVYTDMPVNIHTKHTLLMKIILGESNCTFKTVLQSHYRGSDINSTDNNLHTALMYICKNTSYVSNIRGRRLMKLMLQSGAKVEIDHEDDMYYYDKKSAIGYIIQHITQCDPHDTILLYEYKATLDLLLQFGGNINTLIHIENKNLDSEEELFTSYLIYAIQKKHVHVIHILLQCKNIDLNITDKPKGYTALMYACINKHIHIDIIKLLLTHKPHNINIVEREYNYTVLHICINEMSSFMNIIDRKCHNSEDFYIPRIKLLLKHGADVNVRDRQGKSILCCILEGSLEIEYKNELTELVLESGADVNTMSAEGETPLLYAWFNPTSTHLAPFLLERGADVNACDEKGMTILMRACLLYTITNTPPVAVKQLLDHGANVDAVNETGNSALMYICQADVRNTTHTAVIDLLLTHGADLNLINKAGQTVFDIAYANQDLYNMLMETKHKNDFILK